MACRARATSQAYPTAPRRATRFDRRSSPPPARRCIRAALLPSLSAPKAASVRTAPHRIRPLHCIPCRSAAADFCFLRSEFWLQKQGFEPKTGLKPRFCSQETKFSSGMQPGNKNLQGRDARAGKAGMRGQSGCRESRSGLGDTTSSSTARRGARPKAEHPAGTTWRKTRHLATSSAWSRQHPLARR